MSLQALLTILPDPFYTRITNIWIDLEKRFGIKWIKENVPFPHITWNVAEKYNTENFEQTLKNSLKNLVSINIKTEGLGIFTGEKIVLYLPIKPSKEVLEFHEFFWNLVNLNQTKLNKYYAPTNWFPHITLAVEDINKENIGQVVNYLSDKKFKYNIKLESVSIVQRELGKEVIIKNTFGIPKKPKTRNN